MSARVIFVHDDVAFAASASAALRAAGFDVAPYDKPSDAASALGNPVSVQLLITKAQFARGQQNGLSLALTIKALRPGVKVIFIAEPDLREAVEDVGVCLVPPVSASELTEAVKTLLTAAELAR